MMKISALKKSSETRVDSVKTMLEKASTTVVTLSIVASAVVNNEDTRGVNVTVIG